MPYLCIVIEKRRVCNAFEIAGLSAQRFVVKIIYSHRKKETKMGKISLKSNFQRIAIKDKSAFVTRVITYSRISSDELIDSAARNSAIPKGHVGASCEAVMNEFQNYLLNGHSVEIPHLGTFRLSVSCKSVDKAEDVSANNIYRKKVLFAPSPNLKRLLRSCSFEMQDVDEETIDGGHTQA